MSPWDGMLTPNANSQQPNFMNTLQDYYVSTYLGNRFYPATPHIKDVGIEDIAHGLAYQCRFNGQTRCFYSVAQHSLIVASLVPTRLRLAALLHDAAEAYLGDMVKPLKHLFPEFSRLEEGVMAIIGERFGTAGFSEPPIKRADLIALATEKRDLMPHSTEPWASIAEVVPMPARIQPLPPEAAKAEFLSLFRQIQDTRGEYRERACRVSMNHRFAKSEESRSCTFDLGAP